MYIVNGKGSLINFIAGSFVLLGIILSFTVNELFVYFSAFVGFMLVQSSFTGFCPMYYFLKILGIGEDMEEQRVSANYARNIRG